MSCIHTRHVHWRRSNIIGSYFSVAPGMTCTCITVSPGLFVFVYDAAEHPKRLRRVPSSILVDNSEAFLSCGLAGLGILHGLRPSLAPFIASGELTEILTDFPPPPKPVSLLYPDRRYLAPKVRVFIDWLCEVFGPDAHL